jgi:choline dehydrogenase
MVTMTFESPNAQYNNVTLVSAVVEYAMNKSGPIGSPGYSVSAFLKTKSSALPDVNIAYYPGYTMGGPFSKRGDVVTIFVFCTQSENNGTVTLQSSDVDAHPVISLDNPSNPCLQSLINGIRKARIIAHTAPLSTVLGAELAPGVEAETDEEIAAYIRQHASQPEHWSGTAKMGEDGDSFAVLDSKLRVRGVVGLRVCDTSIMPRLVFAYPHATVLAVAEKAADLVKEELQFYNLINNKKRRDAK